MDKLLAIKDWLLSENSAMVFMVLWGISESLAEVPAIKANSVFQAIKNGMKFIKEKIFKK